jgi:DHA1 family bicyclomycin/chloramphenicol resistance-like MFS transporter
MSLRIPGWIVLMGALTAIGPLSIDMYLPAFPAIAHEFSATGHVEFTLAAYFIGVALGQLFYGPISDSFGRKPPLFIGLALFTIASAAASLATSIESLVLWRFLQGLGSCSGMVIARAVVRDRCEPQEVARVFSLLILVMGLAPILAPMLGGFLLQFSGWRALFGVLTGFGILLLFFIGGFLKESLDKTQAHPLQLGRVLKAYGGLFKHRSFMVYTLCGGLAFSGMFAYIAGSPFVVMQLHDFSPQQYSWMFGANAFGLIAVSQLNMVLLRRYTMTALLRAGLILLALAGTFLILLTLLKIDTLPLLLIGFFVFLCSLGLILPNGGAIVLADQGRQAGTASALMGALQFALATLAGASMSLWHDGSALPLGIIMGGCGLLACFIGFIPVAQAADQSSPAH